MLCLWLICLISFIFLFYHFYWKRRNLPPGPIPLPLLGNALQLMNAKNSYKLLEKWNKKYGPIHTIWMGIDPVIVISDYNLIVETFIKDGDAYSGRVQHEDFAKIFRRGNYGIIQTQGEFWQEQRRFTVHVLRNFGLGRNIMQEKILIEVSDLISKLKTELESGNNVTINPLIEAAIGSVIAGLIFGFRFEGEKLDEFQIEKIRSLVTELQILTGHPLINSTQRLAKWFRNLPIFKPLYDRLQRSCDKLFEYIQKYVDKIEEKLDINTDPKNFVEAYLQEKYKKEQQGCGENYSKIQLLNVCRNLFEGGQETTSDTILWCIIHLMLNPKIQQKVQEELENVVGKNKLITVQEKPMLPFMQAVINESQRIANLLPINVRHTTTRDVIIKGYNIKEGTLIVPHIGMVLYNEEIFPEPETFNPERFLDSSGQLKAYDEFIPFSVGKRQCPGESLAKMMLFLFIANLFNHFEFVAVFEEPPSTERNMASGVSPKPFKCDVRLR